MTAYFDVFAGRDHDEPPRPLGVLAPSTFVLATVPRTGSTLLADALRSSGDDLGVALEYLDRGPVMARLGARWGVSTLTHYLAQLHANRTTPAGWLGVKLHAHQLVRLFALLDGAPPTPDRVPELRQVVEMLFPATRWVRLRREDRIARAVSLWRAQRRDVTVRLEGEAAIGGPEAVDLPERLSREHLVEVRRILRVLDDADRLWDTVLAGVDVHEVRYAALVADPAAVVADVRAHLGLGPGHAPRTVVRRQADEWNERAVEQVAQAVAV